MAIGDDTIGGKRPDRSRLDIEILRGIKKAIEDGNKKRDESERKDDSSKAMKQATGPGEDQAKPSAGRGAFLGGLMTGIGQVFANVMAPMKTGREKEMAALQSAGVEAAAQGAIALTRGFGGSEAAQMRAGQAASEATSATFDAFFDRERRVTDSMRGGFGDLRALAERGIHVSPEQIARRTEAERIKAERGYEFDQLVNNSISDNTRESYDDVLEKAQNDSRQKMTEFEQAMSGMLKRLTDQARRQEDRMRAAQDQAYRQDSAY